MSSLQVTILGAGSWGTALAHLVARQGHRVTLWAREEEVVEVVEVHALAAREGVEMPISEQVYRTLHEDKPVPDAMESLLSRSLKPEWEL